MPTHPPVKTLRHKVMACAHLSLPTLVFSALVALLAPPMARAAGPDVLAECMALTDVDEQVHACLDNYLDLMDDNIGDITAFIRLELTGVPRESFERAQSAFQTYRRENCLWYLAFSTPRAEAEKIAKNCLARMSIDRLAELQALLVRGESPSQAIEGYYVFGSNRNSFRPCNSERRLWVGGDDAAVASLQQQYLEQTSAELQLMFASVTGAVSEDNIGRPDHDGSISVQSVRALRVPSDGDCRLPSDSPPVTAASTEDAGPARSVEDRVADAQPEAAPVEADNGIADLEPGGLQINPVADPTERSAAPPEVPVATAAGERDERLTAYFGAWLADCRDDGNTAACELAVGFDGGDGSQSELVLRRREDGGTTITLALPDGAAAEADDVRWSVDGYGLGKVTGARLRRGDSGLELQVDGRRIVREDLLPLMRDGNTLTIQTQGDGQSRSMTLQGLTRALGFADDYLGAES